MSIRKIEVPNEEPPDHGWCLGYGCGWEKKEATAMADARAHTDETGHDTRIDVTTRHGYEKRHP